MDYKKSPGLEPTLIYNLLRRLPSRNYSVSNVAPAECWRTMAIDLLDEMAVQLGTGSYARQNVLVFIFVFM